MPQPQRSKKPRTRKTAPPSPTIVTSPAIEELFAELQRAPDDDTTLVLADALAEAGDLRAELAQVQRALVNAGRTERMSLATREHALLHALRGRLLGKFAQLPTITLETRLGFVRDLAVIDASIGDLTRILMTALPSPDARLLESLQLVSDEEVPMGLGEVFAELAGKIAVPPSLRRLRIGNAFQRDTSDREIEQTLDDDGDPEPRDPENLRAVLTMFPRLRELVLDLGTVPVELAPLATKNLEVLTWITPCLAFTETAPLARSVLPSLRRFELWIGGTTTAQQGDLDEPFRMRELAPLLAMLERTQLEELAFGHVPRLGKLLAVLEAQPLIKRVKTLELSHLSIDDAGELVDFARVAPALQFRLDGVHASQSGRTLLERRLGSRLSADWAGQPPQFRLLTRGYDD